MNYNKNNLKKAAMFGLDARIALAIFGALSVISGAALYSAIKEAKVIAFITENEEISKAYDAYRLDIGSDLEKYDTSVDSNQESVNFSNLIKNPGVKGWSGPYLTYEEETGVTPAGSYFKKNKYQTFGLRRYAPVNNGSLGGNLALCTSGNTCAVYVLYMPVTESFANDIDNKIDGSIDFTSGKVRSFLAGGNRFLLIQIANEL